MSVVGGRLEHAVTVDVAPQLHHDTRHDRFTWVDDAVVVSRRHRSRVGVRLVVPHQVSKAQPGPEAKVDSLVRPVVCHGVVVVVRRIVCTTLLIGGLSVCPKRHGTSGEPAPVRVRVVVIVDVCANTGSSSHRSAAGNHACWNTDAGDEDDVITCGEIGELVVAASCGGSGSNKLPALRESVAVVAVQLHFNAVDARLAGLGETIVVRVEPHKVADAVQRAEAKVHREVGPVVVVGGGTHYRVAPRCAVVVVGSTTESQHLVGGLTTHVGIGRVERDRGRGPATRDGHAVVVVVFVGVRGGSIHGGNQPLEGSYVGGRCDAHHVVARHQVFEGVLAICVRGDRTKWTGEGDVRCREELNLHSRNSGFVGVCASVILVRRHVVWRIATVVEPHQVAQAVTRYVYKTKINLEFGIVVVIVGSGEVGLNLGGRVSDAHTIAGLHCVFLSQRSIAQTGGKGIGYCDVRTHRSAVVVVVVGHRVNRLSRRRCRVGAHQRANTLDCDKVREVRAHATEPVVALRVGDNRVYLHVYQRVECAVTGVDVVPQLHLNATEAHFASVELAIVVCCCLGA